MDAAPADRAALEEEAIMLSAGEIAAALGGATHNGGGWLTCCCCHEDKRPSLSLRDGDDGKLLVRCFAGCDPRDVLAELRQRGLLPSRRDAGEITHFANPRRHRNRLGAIVATWCRGYGAKASIRAGRSPSNICVAAAWRSTMVCAAGRCGFMAAARSERMTPTRRFMCRR